MPISQLQSLAHWHIKNIGTLKNYVQNNRR